MAFHRSVWRSIRSFHSTIRKVSGDEFDFSKIVKSNSSQKGFNDIEKKKTKKIVKKKIGSESSNDTEIECNKEESTTCTADDNNKAEYIKDSSKRGAKPAKTVKKLKPQLDINGERYKIRIPDWMEVVFECPTNSVDEMNAENFDQFKNFIDELEIKNLPSVTTIIKKTEPADQAQILQKWAKRKTKELGGEKQFQEYRQNLFTRGSSLHSCIELYLAGERDFEVAPRIEGAWESVQHALTDITDVKKTEKVIVHPELFYKGQLDCLASYRNTLSLVEWKVSSKPKILLSQTYDNPLQVAAYIGALNRSGILKRMQVPNITTGVLVIAYEDGEPANVHLMNERICNKYWGRWKERLYHYWALQYQHQMTN